MATERGVYLRLKVGRGTDEPALPSPHFRAGRAQESRARSLLARNAALLRMAVKGMSAVPNIHHVVAEPLNEALTSSQGDVAST